MIKKISPKEKVRNKIKSENIIRLTITAQRVLHWVRPVVVGKWME